jgi:hypothetical protein
MKFLQIVALGAGAIGLAYLARALKTKNAGDSLILDFRDITGVKRDGWKVKFNIRFDATNPTDTSLNLEQAILDLKADGVNGTLARVRNISPIMFLANEKRTIIIPAETDNLLSQGLTMITTLIGIFSGDSSKYKSGTLSGSLKANGFTTAYSKQIRF